MTFLCQSVAFCLPQGDFTLRVPMGRAIKAMEEAMGKHTQVINGDEQEKLIEAKIIELEDKKQANTVITAYDAFKKKEYDKSYYLTMVALLAEEDYIVNLEITDRLLRDLVEYYGEDSLRGKKLKKLLDVVNEYTGFNIDYSQMREGLKHALIPLVYDESRADLYIDKVNPEIAKFFVTDRGVFVSRIKTGTIDRCYLDWGGTLDSISSKERNNLLSILRSINKNITISILSTGDAKEICEILEREGNLDLIDSAIQVMDTSKYEFSAAMDSFSEEKYKNSKVSMVLSANNKIDYLNGVTLENNALFFDNEFSNFKGLFSHIVCVGVFSKRQVEFLRTFLYDGVAIKSRSSEFKDNALSSSEGLRESSNYLVMSLAEMDTIRVLIELLKMDLTILQELSEISKVMKSLNTDL